MRGVARVLVAMAGVCVAAGCRTATRIVDEPRVDIELAGAGNRGYLVGTPPPAKVSKTTRQVLETEIELPGGGGKLPASSGAGATVKLTSQLESPTPSTALPLNVNVGEPAVASKTDQYVVQKGDSLWSIAAKPEVFGNGNRWRELYDANRDVLKGPDKLRAGLTLKVPHGGGMEHAVSDSGPESEGTKFVK